MPEGAALGSETQEESRPVAEGAAAGFHFTAVRVKMTSMVTTERADVAEILREIPDLCGGGDLAAWLAEQLRLLDSVRPVPEVEASLTPIDVGSVLGPRTSPFGHHADATWRRLVVSAFLADWACYRAPVDRVGFDRLLHVMHVFPAGFRLFWARMPEAGWLPVGYTGVHPISAATFEVLSAGAPGMRERAAMPTAALEPGGSFLHLFNYSIIEPLRGTASSKRLVRGLSADVEAIAWEGLSAFVVSRDGRRVAERFGMKRSGTITVEGSEEHIYIGRR
jgi:hypothetical protein